jgi:hypothetical protein
MMSIFLMMFLFLLFILLIMLSSIWFMNRIMKSYIGQKHLLLEHITESKKIPHAWSNKFHKKISKMRLKGESDDAVARIERQAEKAYLKKLNALILYTKKTRLVQDEDTRSLLLNELERARQLWQRNGKYECNA